MPRVRPISHYRRPSLVTYHLETSSSDDVQYQKCSALLDSVMYELFKTLQRYHVVADSHGPLYRVEVMDIIAKLEAIQEIANK